MAGQLGPERQTEHKCNILKVLALCQGFQGGQGVDKGTVELLSVELQELHVEPCRALQSTRKTADKPDMRQSADMKAHN